MGIGRFLGIDRRAAAVLTGGSELAASGKAINPIGRVSVGDAFGLLGLAGDADPGALAVTERARALISQSTAMVPLPVYRRTSDGREEVENHALYRLLNDQASEYQSSFEFRECLARDCLTYGNAYARIVWNGRGEPGELIFI